MNNSGICQFEELKTDLENWFSVAKIDLALLAIAGAYDACLETDIQDGYDTLYEHVEFLLEKLKGLQHSVIDKVETMVIPSRQAYCFFEGLFSHFQRRYHSEGNYLRFFEPLLLCLIREKERAQHMQSMLNKWDIPRHFITRLVTEMYQIEEDREQWINAAENLFDEDVKVARNLLQDYAENSYEDFIRIGQRFWNADLFNTS